MPLIKYAGYRVRVKKGQRSVTPAQRKKISILNSELAARRKSLSKGDGCVIFFPRGAQTAVQRCTHRRLKATNRRQCRDRKKQFVKCRGRRRR